MSIVINGASNDILLNGISVTTDAESAGKIDKVATPVTNALAKVQADGTIKNSGVIEDASGNVGVGVTPSAWGSINRIIDLGLSSSVNGRTDGCVIELNNNHYRDSSNTYRYKRTNAAGQYSINGGAHYWLSAVSGTAGNAIPWTNVMTLDASGNLLLQSGTGGLGYGTGAGGTVTQATSKSTAVTLNKPCGQITMNNAALAAGATVSFFMYNNTFNSYSDIMHVQMLNSSNVDKYNVWAANNGPGFGIVIYLKNIIYRQVRYLMR